MFIRSDEEFVELETLASFRLQIMTTWTTRQEAKRPDYGEIPHRDPYNRRRPDQGQGKGYHIPHRPQKLDIEAIRRMTRTVVNQLFSPPPHKTEKGEAKTSYPYRGEPKRHSLNADFTTQTNNISKTIRLYHALLHWNPIPVALDSQLNRCENIIRPPGYNDKYRAQLTAPFNKLKKDIGELTISHIKSELRHKLTDFMTHDTQDLDIIREVATRNAKRRTKVHDQTVAEALEALEILVQSIRTGNEEHRAPNTGDNGHEAMGPMDPTPAEAREMARITGARQSSPRTAGPSSHTPPNRAATTPKHGGKKSGGPPAAKRQITLDGFEIPNRTAKKQATQQPMGVTTSNPFAPLNVEDELTDTQLIALLQQSTYESSDEDVETCTPQTARKRRLNTSQPEQRQSKVFVTKATVHRAMDDDAEIIIRIMDTPPQEGANSSSGSSNEGIIPPTQQANSLTNTQRLNRTRKGAAPTDEIVRIDDHQMAAPTASKQSAANASTTRTAETLLPSSRQRRLSLPLTRSSQCLINSVMIHDNINAVIGAINKPQQHINTIILADSNARKWDNIPPNWNVHCLPGANLLSVKEILERCMVPRNILHIVVAVGINDRARNPNRLMDLVREVKQAADRFGHCRNHFLMVTQLPNFSDRESRNVAIINRTARDAWTFQNFIQGSQPRYVYYIAENDTAHYDAATAARIVAKITKYLTQVK